MSGRVECARGATGGAPVFGGSAPPCKQACSKWCTCSVRSAGQSLALRGGCGAAPAVDATHAAKASSRSRRAMRAAPRARAARAGAPGDNATGGAVQSHAPLPRPVPDDDDGTAIACAVRALRTHGAARGDGCAGRCGSCAAPCAGVAAAARQLPTHVARAVRRSPRAPALAVTLASCSAVPLPVRRAECTSLRAPEGVQACLAAAAL